MVGFPSSTTVPALVSTSAPLSTVYNVLPANSTSIFIYDCVGNLSKVLSYTQAGAMAMVPNEDVGFNEASPVYSNASITVLPQIELINKKIGTCCGTNLNPSIYGSLPAGVTYQWYKKGRSIPMEPVILDSKSKGVQVTSFNPITGATNQNLIVNSPGEYKIIITGPNGCTTSATCIVTLGGFSCCPIPDISYSAARCSNGNNDPKQISGVIAQPITLSGDTTWVDGTLSINNGSSLKFDNQVVIFSANGKIVVNPGGRLDIINSKLDGCSENTWEGIEVKGNGTDANQFTLISSKIYNALNPVKMDKVDGGQIVGNLFYLGDIVIQMDRNKSFIINRNIIFGYTTGIKTSMTQANPESFIKENTFFVTEAPIVMSKDDHSNLNILCNKFDGYLDYAIKTDQTVLKDQGTLAEGAGNDFVSTSTLTNHKLNHNGNNVNYYYGPSETVLANEMSITPVQAQANGGCYIIPARLGNNANQDEISSTPEEYDTVLSNTNNQTTIPAFKIYPNPNNGNMSLEYVLNSGEKGIVTIYDVPGRKVYQSELISDKSLLMLNEKKLSEGIYTCIISVNGYNRLTQKVIVVR